MAQHSCQGEDPIGKRFRRLIDPDYTQVAGVCADAVVAAIGEPEEEIIEFVCGENNRDADHYRGK
jgi:hypothetical protein